MHGQHHIAAGEPCRKIGLFGKHLPAAGKGFKFQFDLPGREGKQLPGPFDPGFGCLGKYLPRGFIQAPVISSIAA